MKRLVEFPLEGGGMVVVEVDEPEAGGNVRAARGDTIETAKETLEDALNKVLPAAHSIVEKLQVIRPDTIEVTFGIKLSFKAGAFITAGTDANFDVKVSWSGSNEPAAPTIIDGKSSSPKTTTN
jgi:predicted RNase H-like HicB family nuclease